MICNGERSERLYLSKGDQDIYIDNCKIPQHHIDGIRFLYRQYKKKKSGVIINYRPEYARNLQIVLFLKAMHSLLKKPVLILCKEGAEHNWMEQFQTWTDFYDEVVFETQKPFVKKLVLINTMSNLPVFSRHEWSVVIVDDDETSYQVLKLPFKADYKIYTTSVNMKENLDTFSQVYKWLYPKEAKGKWKFDKNDFIADKDNVRDVIDKAIILDAFMEDIVATNSTTTDTCSQKYNAVSHEIDSSPSITVSRKNKDATGTKIKRSRKIEHEDDDDIPLSKAKEDNSAKECNKIKSLKVNHNKRINNATIASLQHSDEDEDFNIKIFKKKKNDIFKEEDMILTKHLEADGKMDSVNGESQLNLYYEPDSATDINSDRFYEMDTLVFSDVCGDQGSNINEPVTETSNLDRENEVNIIELTEVANKVDTEIDDNTQNKIESDKEEILRSPLLYDEMNSRNNEFEINKSNIDEIKSNISDMKSNIYSKDSPSTLNEFNIDDNEVNLKNDQSLNVNEINSNIDEKHNGESLKIVKEISNEINIDPKLNKREAEIKQSGFNNSTKTTSKTDTDVNVLKRNCIEDEIQKMEEKVLKKFKGSILDSLF